MFDVDIDVVPYLGKAKYGTLAIIHDEEENKLRPHSSGVYFNCNIPIDPISKRAALDYKRAEELGFIKYDLLSSNYIPRFNTQKEFIKATQTEPDWDLLWTDKKTVTDLPHVGNHYDILKKYKPKSVEDLADCLALIRPAKIYLQEDYAKNKTKTRLKLYTKEANGKYYFKKSHAIAYALLIVAVLNAKSLRPLEHFFDIR